MNRKKSLTLTELKNDLNSTLASIKSNDVIQVLQKGSDIKVILTQERYLQLLQLEMYQKKYTSVHTFEELDACIQEGVKNLRLMFNPIGMFDEISAEAIELICDNKYLVSKWDVSNVTNMSWMFCEAEFFNQPLNSWDVSNVTNMRSMFYCAKSFNQPLDKWDVSNVTDMSRMFYVAKSFNQPLGKWKVSNVTNMNSMFAFAESFNQPLGKWDVSNVTDMLGMFWGTESFDQPLNNWNVFNVTEWNYFRCKSPLTDQNTPAKFREQEIRRKRGNDE